jgi:hypothetical protein
MSDHAGGQAKTACRTLLVVSSAIDILHYNELTVFWIKKLSVEPIDKTFVEYGRAFNR